MNPPISNDHEGTMLSLDPADGTASDCPKIIPTIACRVLLRLACLGLFVLALPALAFPPAPHHQILGMVRDEMGNPVEATGARVVLETQEGHRYVGNIAASRRPGVNYELRLPLDSQATSDVYKTTAMRPAASFRISVAINGKLYLPIEMRGNFATLGQPTEVTRLDLTLGEDGDGDGIPDAWQRALAKRLGVAADQIRPGDDSDGDGMSNREEYLAGTYAYDPKEGFALTIERLADGRNAMAFLAVPGRSYTVLGSTDLHDWRAVEFREVDGQAEGTAGGVLQTSDVRTVRVQALADGREVRFYRLMVQ